MRLRLTLISILAAAACSRSVRPPPAAEVRSDKLVRARSPIAGQYVVTLSDAVAPGDVAATAADLAARHGGTVRHVYGAALHGFALSLPAANAAALAIEARVVAVEEDGVVRAAATVAAGSPSTTTAPPPPTGAGVHLYVLDTGIRADHVELAGRASAGYPDPSVAPASRDCNGHGTWVAALAAGKTLGVAPEAQVHAVRVLGCDGAGAVSDVIAGLDWVAANRIAPAALLLALSTGPSPALDAAVSRSVAAGLPAIAAAGNAGGDACEASPARAPDAITAGAIASAPAGSPLPYVPLPLSNAGACVDLLAPGDAVTSAWNVDAASTHVMSGTSAAAARAAGAAALVLQVRPDATPAQVAAALAGTARTGTVDGLGTDTPDRVLDASRIKVAPPDTTAPTTSVTAPVDGATVTGRFALVASAQDDVEVTQVAFHVDGRLVGVVSAAPWQVTWNSALAGNGPHAVESRAYDAAGNVGTSAPVAFTVENDGFASWDALLGTPSCLGPTSTCDTGPALVLGRGPVGPEPNHPNAIGLPCPDGTAGAFHLDESVDAIRIATLDGSPLAAGKGVEVRVKLWAYADHAGDALDLWLAKDATAPAWNPLVTLTPERAGEGTLVYRFTLPAGPLQALRAALRYRGDAAVCTTGLYDDRDDLVFAVGEGTEDTTPPQVAVTSPAASAILGGLTTVSVAASDDRGVVDRVELLVDGATVGTARTPDPTTGEYRIAWDAHTVPDGAHVLAARAVDGARNVATSATVAIQVADVVAPEVELLSPAPRAQVRDVVRVEAYANDDRGVTRVTFLANGVVVGTATAAPWTTQWNTASFTGAVALTAVARDAAGHETTSPPVDVYVDREAPSVSIIEPLPTWSTPTDPAEQPQLIPPVVSGSVRVRVATSDGALGIAGVGRVELYGGGQLVGVDERAYPTAPCTITWGSGTFPNGLYDLVAKAWDRAGNLTVSDPVTVEVKDEAPPTVAIVTPADGATLRLVAPFTATASDDGILDHVDLLLDGALLAQTGTFTTAIETRAYAAGPHTLTATAYDGVGNHTTKSVEVKFDNTPPTIQLVAPAAPATVSGMYLVKVDASDDQVVDHVDFYVGANVAATVRAAPFEWAWNTANEDNADFDVAAIAYDAAGNAATSATVRMTVRNATTTDWAAGVGVPACLEVGPSCFTGTLVRSRASLTPVPELHASNTLDGCQDGLAGKYGEDESIDAIRVRTVDGTPLAPGKAVDVDVTFSAVSTDFDRVDLFYAPDASAPAWVSFATLAPAQTGLQTLTARYTLPTGPLQAIRAAMRYAETGPATCARGDFDDRDDVVFAVETPGADHARPRVSITSPTNGGTVHGWVTVALDATDDQGLARVDLRVDGTTVASAVVPPYVFPWNSAAVADGLHALTAAASDTSGNESVSNAVAVTVRTAPNAAFDAARGAPLCGTEGSFCDSGSLLEGRGLLGPELDAPSTLQGSCQDGAAGTYLVEESVEAISVETEDGSPLEAGRPATVHVTVFASAAFDNDWLDLYQATSADAPAWRHVATVQPPQAGLQDLVVPVILPPGGRQALRARFRFGGAPGPCGTFVDDLGISHGLYDDHDDLGFAVRFVPNAAHDASLGAPRCRGTAFYCDSGTLLDGRDGKGPEAHAPNTLGGSCADGTAGTYHVDPSVDAVRVYSPTTAPLAAGAEVAIEVEVWASSLFADEALDLFVTADADALAPTWTYLATLRPDREGRQTLSSPWTLPAGAVQAIRASYRTLAPDPVRCSDGPLDDHDDLVFDVGP